MCHAKATARRLGLHTLAALDVLEIFAFVHPARQAVPTVRGLARALGLALPESIEDEAATLLTAAEKLLATLAAPNLTGANEAPAIARTMARAGWLWGDAVVAALEAGGQLRAGRRAVHRRRGRARGLDPAQGVAGERAATGTRP